MRPLRVALASVSLLVSGACGAAEVAGVRLPDKVALAKGLPELVLNGAGVRHRLVTVEVYVGALYLAQKKTKAEEVLADPGPKRVMMHVLAPVLTAKEFVASLNDAIAANHIPAEIALIEKRLRDLNRAMAAIGRLERGGVVFVDFLPGIGTRLTVNGEERITIPGEDFYRALLKVWIGERPVDGRLRKALLGG
jgi:long-chain acyl-CoA synthetase